MQTFAKYRFISVLTRPAFLLVLGIFFCLPALATGTSHPSQNETEKSANATVNADTSHALTEGEHGSAHQDSKKLNPSKIILEHVLDGYSFHFFDYGGHTYGIDLPVIVYASGRGWSVFSSARFNHGHTPYHGFKLEENKIVAVDEAGNVDEHIAVMDLSITRNVAQMFLGVLLLFLIALFVANVYKKKYSEQQATAPKGLQNAVESVIVFVRDDIAKPNLGKKSESYLPFLLSVFFFILINNLLGLIPGSANVTGNIAFTLVLSIVAFVLMLISSTKTFWMHIAWPPNVPFFVKFILIPVEFLGIFTKPFALMIRLFANMLAGHIIIICFVITIFVLAELTKAAGWGFSPVSVAFMVFIYAIELLVAFIQAYIFTTLTSVFIGQMMEGSDGEHH